MGIVHAICQASGLGIASHVFADVRVVLVAPVGDTFEPIALPIYGNFDDYGNIEKPVLLDGDRAIASGILDMHARGELWWSDTAEIDAEISEANLVAILEEIRQGMIFEAVRQPDAPSLSMRANGVPIYFVYILDRFYDAVITMQRRAMSEQQQDELDERQEGPFEVLAAAVAVPELSARLLADTSSTRDELVELGLFRSWFDRHRTWRPISTGEQFTGPELRARAKAARTELAPWPALVSVLDRYEQRI
jgi:hypothetical protein